MKRITFLILMVYLLVGCGGILTRHVSDPSDAAKKVLDKVAEDLCGGNPETSFFKEKDTTYTLFCFGSSHGHYTIITLEWFNTESEARAAFDARSKDSIITEFHGAPLVTWSKDDPLFPGGYPEYETWQWQKQQWLVTVSSFDDTHFRFAPPEGVSETIYQLGLKYGLFTRK